MFDAFLKIDGIEGESTDDKHKGEIDVESFSWGLTQSGTFAFGGGGGAGKVQFQDFHFTKRTDKASPKLFLGCATGEHIKSALLTGVREGIKGGEGSEAFVKIELTDVLISSYQTAGASGEALPVDQVSLNFSKIVYSVASQRATGAVEWTTAGWDLKANKKV